MHLQDCERICKIANSFSGSRMHLQDRECIFKTRNFINAFSRSQMFLQDHKGICKIAKVFERSQRHICKIGSAFSVSIYFFIFFYIYYSILFFTLQKRLISKQGSAGQQCVHGHIKRIKHI